MPVINEKFRQIIEPALFRFKIIPLAKAKQRKAIKRIQDRGHASVVFIVSSLPMWRFQKIYQSLHDDSRFTVSLAIYPFPTFSTEQKKEAINALCDYCSSNHIDYLNLSNESMPGKKLRESIDPDIIFYPQPYNDLYYNDLDCKTFNDKLLCYIPYSIYMTNAPWVYKSLFNNIAWMLFYGSDFSRSYAKKVLYNNGRNIRVVGEPMADFFAEPSANHVWKPQDKLKKKVIWAPHFSLVDEGLHHRDSFTWLSEEMLKLASYYKDSIQFTFKPHPRLYSVLVSCPDWGEEKTAAYYKQWEDGDNTQLETGPYVDLFKESDAMIHDCGSFSVEYHLTGNPAMFVTKDIDKIVANKNEVGRKGILAHYIGKTEEDIVSFLEHVVLNGKDPKKEERVQFKRQYLDPPGGKSVSEAIFQDILKELHFNN